MKNGAGVCGTPGAEVALDLKFSSEGWSGMLAIVVGDEKMMLTEGTSEPIHNEWILHIPSGKFEFFYELFANPQQARERFSGLARTAQNSFYVTQGDEQKRRDVDLAYSNAISNAITPMPQHFRRIGTDNSTSEDPMVVIRFEYRNIMSGVNDFPAISLHSSGFRNLLKPEFRNVFSPAQS